MQESREVRGRTVEEATERALEELGLRRDQVELTVIRKGKTGFFGLGSEEAAVLVRPLKQNSEEPTEAIEPNEEIDTAALAKEVLEDLLRLMNLDATVEVTACLEGEAQDAKSISLDVKGDDLGVLIGRRGETLASLQYIVRLIVARYQRAKVPISIDVEGYKQRRYGMLRELAVRLAQKVKTTGQSTVLEPMPPDERRIVHLALSISPDVTTQSIGEGEVRKVAIVPRKH